MKRKGKNTKHLRKLAGKFLKVISELQPLQFKLFQKDFLLTLKFYKILFQKYVDSGIQLDNKQQWPEAINFCSNRK